MRPALFLNLALAAALIQGVRLPAAGEEEELPVILRSFAPAEAPAPPFEEGRFLPRPGETIALLGGTNVFEEQRHAHLELRLHLAFPELGLRVRHLAWQGDTLYHQARPAHFYTRKGDAQPGSVPDHRERTEAGIVFLAFGQMESLEGLERFPAFLDAYGELLDQLAALTGRVVLVTPVPFSPVGHAASLAAGRNEILALYAEGIRWLAEGRGLLHVDLFTMMENFDPSWTLNGIHLSEEGHGMAAAHFAGELDFPAFPESLDNPAAIPALRQAIARKNRLWQQYYRPTNWAFLFGDRQHVPASRGHEDREERWFIREVDAIPPLLAETEEDIHRYAREAIALPLP